MMKITDAIATALCTLLRPLVRILLRHNIPLPTFVELAKWIYVDVANSEFHLQSKKQSVSRVAMLTGLTRKEILRLNRQESPIDYAAMEHHHRATRVISGWVRDPLFHTNAAEPAPLNLDDTTPSFNALARQYSGDIPSRAVLDELLRLGLVELTAGDKLKLVARAFIPTKGIEDKLAILGTDTADLITTIDHNLHRKETESPFFQRKVCYYNFPTANLSEFHDLVTNKAQPLLEELDAWLAAHDQEADDDMQPRRRVGVSIFYFDTAPIKEDHSS